MQLLRDAHDRLARIAKLESLDVGFVGGELTVDDALVRAGSDISLALEIRRRHFMECCNALTQASMGCCVFDGQDDYNLEKYTWVGKDPRTFLTEVFETTDVQLYLDGILDQTGNMHES